MKTRKNLMVLVLLSLFLSVGVADSDVSKIDLDELKSLTEEDTNTSGKLTEKEMENLFNLDDSEEKALDKDTAQTNADTAQTNMVTEALKKYSNSVDSSISNP